MEAGSSAKIVDCVLGLKEYNERKMRKEGNGTFKHSLRSPLSVQSNGRKHKSVICLDADNQFELPANIKKQPLPPPSRNDAQKLEGFLMILTLFYLCELWLTVNAKVYILLQNGWCFL